MNFKARADIDFSKMNGLLPAIVQDRSSKQVLMLGFMNQEAYEKTCREGKVTFFSRTKKRLWTKGEESGNFLIVKEIKVDCDRDTLLIYADPLGPVCHTGSASCFSEPNPEEGQQPPSDIAFLSQLQALIQRRKEEMPKNSYTSHLFASGVNKMAQKVGEEAVELVIEAMDSRDELFLNEAADLIYHLLVLLTARGFSLGDVAAVLSERHR
ncbi:MAG: bifunctional phosphoribosyl-AMP cyclohydrolase/phosphoribosyl-ATP diphosphatase [Bacteroidetes bacterium]|nr:MAG: bifunctional phosphoribosyl-AMP cyclohydrolase/phosphoribosyl-ATP diphosphatase [Bacteroidota bacterium]